MAQLTNTDRARLIKALKLAEKHIELLIAENESLNTQLLARHESNLLPTAPHPTEQKRDLDLKSTHQFNTLNQACTMFREENIQLHSQLAALKREFEIQRVSDKAQFQTKIRDLEYQLSATEKPIKTLGQQKNTDVIAQHEMNERQLQVHVNDLKLKNTQLLIENDDLRAKQVQLSTQIDLESHSHTRTQFQLKSSMESVQSKCDVLESKVAQSTEYTRTLVQNAKQLTHQVHDLESKIVAMQSDMQGTLDAHNALVYELRSQLKIKAKQVSQLERHVLFACEPVGGHRNDPSTPEIVDRSHEIQSLKDQLFSKHQVVEQLKSKLKSMASTMDEMHATHLLDKESLIKKLNTCMQNMDHLQNDHNALTRKYRDQSGTLSTLTQTESELRANLKRVQLQADTLLDEVNSMRESEAWIQPELQKSKQLVFQLETDLSRLRSEMAAERTMHRDVMAKAKAVWVKSHTDLTQLLDRTAASHTQLKETHVKLKSSAQSKITMYRTSLSNLQSQYTDILEKCRHLQTQLNLATSKVQASERDNSFHQTEFLAFLKKEMNDPCASKG